MKRAVRNRLIAQIFLIFILLISCRSRKRSVIVPTTTSVPLIQPTASAEPQAGGEQQLAVLGCCQSDLAALSGLPIYQLRLKIDPDQAMYQGELQLHYTNLENTSLAELYFRLYPNGGKSYGGGSLGIAGAAAGGKPADTTLTLDRSVLRIHLEDPIQPGETEKVEMKFTGDIPRDFEGGGYGIYNLTDSTLVLAGWFPLLAVYDDEGWNLDPVSAIGDSVYSDMAYFDVLVTAPDDWTLIGTGSKVPAGGTGDLPGGQRFVSGPARDFLIAAGTDYQEVSGKVQDVMITSYYLPGHAAGGEAALRITGQSLEIFNDLFGRYPYRELDVVEVPMRYAAGVEFPGVSLLASGIYDSPDSSWFATVAAHEAAHQWWYHLVGNDVIDEPWLDEALATYSSTLYFEEWVGESMAEEQLEYYRQNYQSIDAGDEQHSITAGLDYFESSPSRRGAYSPVVYLKGAVFFHELRKLVGDQAFFEGLRAYFQANRYSIGTPEQLLGSWESRSDLDLDAFYRQWLGPGTQQ